MRLWIIRHLPDPDTDAPGHLGIARALLANPTNVAVHWVYLPAYHGLLALLQLAGLSANAIRVFNCMLAALIPALVLRYGETTASPSASGLSRHVPWMAATLCAVSPLVNLLGTSAQQETLFTLLVLGTAWSIDTGRFTLGGVLLAIAALVRYEAWGAVGLLVAAHAIGRAPAAVRRLPGWAADVCRLPLVTTLPSLVAIGAWLLAHKLSDGQWFGFLRELYRFTHLQREGMHRTPEADLFWFPIRQPLFVFGWIASLLFVAGIRRSWRPGYVVPLGLYLFLEGAYVFKGALGSARYYESLTPFVALAAARGACAFGSRRRGLVLPLFAAAALQLTLLSVQMYRWTWPTHRGQARTVASPSHPVSTT